MRRSLVPVVVFLVSILILLVIILQSNEKHFLYTLDDPYIHLALSKNIAEKGHYGINLGENTAPSSSILWPFLLIPFVMLQYGYLAPFLLNILFALVTIYLLSKYFKSNLIAVVSVFAFNLVGLVFTGMEHSLQVLLVVMIAVGVMDFKESGKVRPLLVIALFLAPLIRYENLAIAIPVMGYMFYMGSRKNSILIFSLVMIALVGFSLFLVSLGLDPFPASVNAKSSVVSGSGRLILIIKNFTDSLQTIRGMSQFILFFPLLLAFKVFRDDRGSRALALTAIAAILLHFAVGRFGWFHRYGVYIWVFSVMVICHLFKSFVLKHKSIFAILLLVLSANYVYGFRHIPAASNNIYQQQFQMRRFVHNWLDGPIAVNDLGLVAMDNQNYVLDLWGLATPGAIQGASSPAWIDSSALSNDVSLAIVYRDQLPGIYHWKQIAQMDISSPLVVCVNSRIDFLAAPWANEDSLKLLLSDFKSSLPSGISLVVVE